jgi:PII-like signaling protein
MLAKGPAKKVTIYLNEDTKSPHGPLYQAIVQFLKTRSVAGATLMRPHSGFGSHHQIHSPDMEAQAEHLPIRIEFVDTPERVDRLLPTLYDMVTDGLIEVQDTTILKAATSAEPAPYVKRTEKKAARMLRVFLGEADQWEGEPLYDAIVKTLRMMEISGATVNRGILGYGAKGHTHKQSFFHLSRDLPVMISVVDSPQKLEQAAAAIEQMMSDGLIVESDVEVVRVIHAPDTTS